MHPLKNESFLAPEAFYGMIVLGPVIFHQKKLTLMIHGKIDVHKFTKFILCFVLYPMLFEYCGHYALPSGSE